MTNDWTIQEVARLAGTTSRALRHYGELGLLTPTRTGAGGMRHYDAAALSRLQRILLLRQLGLGLPQIAEVLAGATDDVIALRNHIGWLRTESERIARQIASVETTVAALEKGHTVSPTEMFDGFDHAQYREEVVERWGEQTWNSSTDWWNAKTPEEKKEWQGRQAALADDWTDAAAREVAPDSDEAQQLAQRHHDWLKGIPGTPQTPSGAPLPEYVLGLGDMYVADERFAANYGGVTGATLVRDALRHFMAQRG